MATTICPVQLYFCKDWYNITNIKYNQLIAYPHYPGQVLNVYIAALDGANRSVGASVLLGRSIFQSISLTESNKSCHCIYILIQFKPSRKTIILSLGTSISEIKLVAHIHPCPLGFKFNSDTKTSDLFKIIDGITCNITTTTIRFPTRKQFWIGPLKRSHDTNNPLMAITQICPPEFCNDNITTSWNITESQCHSTRDGLFCSLCKVKNFSVVFGSNQCFECTNYWLFSIIGYLVAGVLLIYLLFRLKFTLTHGTVTSVTFYMHVSNNYLLPILSTGMTSENGALRISSHFTYTCVSIGLGFPLCFYNGMSESAKFAFLFAFPLYLLGLVLMVVLVSRRSSKVSNLISNNGVPVLATVVHLSFSCFARNIIDVFSPVILYVNDSSTQNMWYRNATISFTDTSHVLLMSFSLLSICFIVPYIVLLLYPKLWLRFYLINKYLRPFIDAILAPYSENRSYWFGLRLLLVLELYIMSAYYRGSEYITKVLSLNGTTFTIFCVLHTFCRPFKSYVVNILDTWLILNLSIVYISTSHSLSDASPHGYVLIGNIMALLMLVTFVGVLIYHVLLAFGKVDLVKSAINRFYWKWTLLCNKVFKYEHTTVTSSLHLNGSFYGSCNVREPLLEN